MIYSSEGDQQFNTSRKQAKETTADAQSGLIAGDDIREVDDKVLHEDDEDIETSDKIDDAELDLSGPISANDDEEIIEVKDTARDAAEDHTPLTD